MCLVTVRHTQYEAQTLAQIVKQTGWQPDETFFRDRECSPPQWKESVLKKIKHRYPDATLLAIESNDDNAAMYVRNGVLALKVWTGQHRYGPRTTKSAAPVVSQDPQSDEATLF